MIRRPPRSTLDRSSAASDVYKRQDRQGAGDGEDLHGVPVGLPPVVRLHVHDPGLAVREPDPSAHDLAVAAAVGALRDVLALVSYTHLRAHETPEHLVCRL